MSQAEGSRVTRREHLRAWAGKLRTDLAALRLAVGDPRVPRRAKWLAGATVAYAVSPIDLIPDWIPVLGHLDDLILVPAGIAAAIRMIPPDVWAELRATAGQGKASKESELAPANHASTRSSKRAAPSAS